MIRSDNATNFQSANKEMQQQVEVGRDGLVRSVRIRTQKGTYMRPITTIVLLEEI